MLSKKLRLLVVMLICCYLGSACMIAPGEIEMIQDNSEAVEEAFDVNNIRPQDDFFGYINAATLMETEVDPVTGDAGVSDQLYELADERITEIIHDVVAGDRSTYADGSNEQMVYDVYYQLLDATTNDVEGYSEIAYDELMNVYNMINEPSDINEFLGLLGTMHTDYGVNGFFNVRAHIDELNTSEYALYNYTYRGFMDFEKVARGTYEAKNLNDGIVQYLTALGVNSDEASERASAAVYVLIDIANNTDFDLLRGMNSYTEATPCYSSSEMDELLPNIGYEGFETAIGFDNPYDYVYVKDPTQLASIDGVLIEDNLQALKDIQFYEFVNSMRMFIPQSLVGSLDITYSDDSMAISTIENLLGEQISYLYYERYLDTEAQADVTDITNDIIDEYIVLISECEWLSDEAKELITTKLNNIDVFICEPAPQVIHPENAEIIADNIFKTGVNLASIEFRRSIEELGTPVISNGTDGMSMADVNAYYDPFLNSINITIGIMQAPYYDVNASRAENLGGIGMVVGHEISHAFDSAGIKYNANSDFDPGWIPQADIDAFEERQNAIIEYYNNWTILDVHHVNGELTLGENLADISSMECIVELVDSNDEAQALLENYARCWADITTSSSALDQLYNEVHSPCIIRVNAVVALLDVFYEIYDVQEGDAMYVAPENRVTRW